ncbi:MAG: 2-amino-4-hydroxy-6-hydroxymethyldihydropteridine diphosphokinase [Deltaproteobacteria bacterium]|nr:MAG: 2-amino-4-hydroxy-6-hydroxymethyldihydropteridine diphosphokinase [Deltaproteobacteria bacterium]
MGEVTAYIGLGSNLGDGRKILRSAWKTLGDAAGVELVALARPYRTAPVGMASEHWFTNSVGCLRTSLAPEELLSLLFRVEADFGRKRDETVPGYHDRSLDLDLLYFGELCLDTPRLVLPHPGITERLFVLVPLAELEKVTG